MRYGLHKQLEEQANELIRRSLEGVTSHREKSDVLTPWKEAERYRREVYPASGVADSTRRGMFHRVANSARPDLNGRDGSSPPMGRSRTQSLSTFVAEHGGLPSDD